MVDKITPAAGGFTTPRFDRSRLSPGEAARPLLPVDPTGAISATAVNVGGVASDTGSDFGFGEAAELFGTVLEGASSIGVNLVGEKVKEETRKAAEGVRDEFTAAAGPNVQVPASLTNALGRTERLKRAYNEGKIKDSTYWARLNTETKALRARFPGFEEEIDRAMAQVTGAIPANRLRSALLRENLPSRKGKSPQEERMDFVLKWGKYLNKQWTDGILSGQKSLTAATRVISTQLSGEQTLEMAKAQREDRRGKREETKEQLEDDVQLEVDLALRDSAALAELDQHLEGLSVDLEGRARKGVPVSPQEKIELETNLAAYLREYENTINKIFNKNPGLSAEAQKRIRAAGLERARELTNAITNEDYGTAGLAVRMLNAMRDQTMHQFMSKDSLRNAFAIKRMLGPDALLQFGSFSPPGGTPSLQNQVQRDLYLFTMYDNLMSPDPKSLSQWHESFDIFTGGKKKKAAFDKAVNDLTKTISDPSTPTEGLMKVATKLYKDPSLIAQLGDQNHKFNVFMKATAPNARRRMQDLREAGEQRSWEQFSTFTQTGFRDLFLNVRDDIRSQLRSTTSRYQVRYNSATRQIDLLPKDGRGIITRLFDPLAEGTLDESLKENVKRINAALRHVIPVMEIENPKGVDSALRNMLLPFGIEVNTSTQGKGASLGGGSTGTSPNQRIDQLINNIG